MRKLTLRIVVFAGVLAMICIAIRILTGNTYVLYLPMDRPAAEPEGLQIYQPEEEGPPVSYGDLKMQSGYIRVEIHPKRPGSAFDEIRDKNGEVQKYIPIQVDRFMNVYDKTSGGFTGDTIILGAFAVFFLVTGGMLLHFFVQCKGSRLYTYDALYAAGFSIFVIATGVLLIYLTIRRIVLPQAFSMYSAYSAISSASYQFMLFTSPFVLAFSVLMAMSNIELLRHERRRFANVLGLLISVLMVAGWVLAVYLYSRDFSGSMMQKRIHDTVLNMYATVYVYFECMLIGAIICGIRAVRHVPEPDQDYILILGCGFRKDGSLPPLLKGRVDRAVRFWREQREKTGKTAVLIPSGGQGPDETMPESEAMSRYLKNECGIPETYIMKEDQSRNTYQNMEYSMKLIEDRERRSALGVGFGTPKTIFSTTNYHVFRSGVWAGLAGLDAEGIGSRTKWWFWPNAFIRECVGLLRNRIVQEIVLLVVLTAVFAILSMLQG